MSTNTLTVAQAGLERAHGTTLGRLGALAGIGFTILFVVGTVLITNTPDEDVAEAELLAFYADGGNRVQVVSGLFLIAIAGALLLGFLASLRAALSRSHSDHSPLIAIATTAGTVFVTMLFAAAAAIGSVPVAMELGSSPQPGVDVTRLLPQVGYSLLLLFGMLAASTMVIVISTLVLRSADFPRWFGWLGIVCGGLLLFSVMFMPIIALPIWTIAASIVLLRQQPAA